MSDGTLLKAIASMLLEPIWKSEFYNDAEDYINYYDPRAKRNPRPENEVNRINRELNRIGNDILDEIVDDLQQNSIIKIDNILNNEKLVQQICHTKFSRYRRELWNVVRIKIPSKRV